MRIDIPKNNTAGNRLFSTRKFKVFFIIAAMFFGLVGMAGAVALYSGASPTGVVSKLKQKVSDQFVSVNATLTAPKLARMQLDVEFEDFEKIRAKRDEALASGFMISSDEDLVPATLTVGGEALDAKVRLKGDLLDHLTTSKWSYRIELKGDDRAFGMRRFSVQHPQTRKYQFEQAYFENLRHEGVLAPKYEFVELAVNGEDLGIYALEEFFGKELIESQGRRSGILLGFDEQYFWGHVSQSPISDRGWGVLGESYTSSNVYIQVFDGGRVRKDAGLEAQAQFAVTQLRKFQEGALDPSDVFDNEKMGTFLAIAELWQAHHSLVESNIRFYYNPISGFIEPVGFDANPSPRLSGKTEVFFTVKRLPFLKRVLDDPKISARFMSELERVSDPAYFTEIQGAFGQKTADSLASLQAEFPRLEMVWDQLKDRQAILRKIINPPFAGIAYGSPGVDTAGSPEIALDVANPVAVPIEITGIRIIPLPGERNGAGDVIDVDVPGQGGEAWTMLARNVYSDPLVFERMNVPITDSIAEMIEDGAKVELNVRVLGQDTIRRSPVVIMPQIVGNSAWQNNDFSAEDAIEKHPFLKIESHGVLSIESGTWDVDSDLVIPADYSLVVHSGVTLRFAEGTRLVSSSPVHLLGDESAPVIFEPSQESWAGVFVQSAGESSIWRYAIIRDTVGIDEPGRLITGGVTFNESPLTLRNVTFDGTQAEDALNVVLAGIDFENVTFARARSDGFDGDAIVGNIDRAEFLDIEGDGLDVSASDIVGTRLSFVNIGDKAISIGEASHAQFSDITVIGAGIGIASKDLSGVTINGADLSDIAHFSLASYQKKPEYGPSSLHADNIRQDGNERYAVEGTSEILLDGRAIAASDLDVDELYAVGILGN